ncbi:sensor histidine kinase [Nocardioides pantholopis]|uniref:sensor histidine kinase n=1 Tax=Nocardioides pantholopis TaxID=2483798 RepID=UPI0013DDFE82|nr:histidine kinase [Nocardioides pantholopis]
MTARRTDVLLGLGVTLALTAVVSANEGDPGTANPLAYLWAVGLGLLMLVRRQRPVLVLVLTMLGFVTYYMAGFPAIGVGVPMAAAVFSAAETGHLRAAVTAGVLILALATGYRILDGQDATFILGYELVSHAALIAAAIALGHSVRVGTALRRRTEQVTGLLTRQGELDADARLREERLALARELHDSIGHSLAVAALYAQVAREAGPDGGPDGQQRHQAIELVRSAVSDALAQLRRTVAVLRGSRSPTEPEVGIGDLPQLAAAPRSVGYVVELDLELDDDVAVPAEVGAAAYRVAQEAVTNAIRHSSGTRISIRVAERAAHELEVVVRDDGRVVGSPDLRPGHGLSGMAERLGELGGALEVSAGTDGWLVRARIPWDGAR